MKNITPYTNSDTTTSIFSWKASKKKENWMRPNGFRRDAYQSPILETTRKSSTSTQTNLEGLKDAFWTLSAAAVKAIGQKQVIEAYMAAFGGDGDYYSWLNHLAHRGVFVFSEEESLVIYETAKQEMKDRMNYGE